MLFAVDSSECKQKIRLAQYRLGDDFSHPANLTAIILLRDLYLVSETFGIFYWTELNATQESFIVGVIVFDSETFRPTMRILDLLGREEMD